MQTSREVNERELRVETEELNRFPAEETDELAALYESRGLAPAGARQLAESVIANGPMALEVMAREELGIDPDQLGGSPWRAAASSFIMFCLGAFVPLVAFFFASRKRVLITSVALSAIVLLVLGAAVTTLTGRSPLRSAIRQLLFGLGAAAITYAIGRAVGGVVG